MEIRLLSPFDFEPAGRQYLRECARVLSPLDPATAAARSDGSNKESYRLFDGFEKLKPPIVNRHADAMYQSEYCTYEEELFISGSSVVWSRENIVQKCFSFKELGNDENILQALFGWFILDLNASTDRTLSHANFSFTEFSAEFSPSKCGKSNRNNKKSGSGYLSESTGVVDNCHPKRAIVILFPNEVKMYFDDGQHYSIPLPFTAKKAWALDIGILIECDIQSLENFPADKIQHIPTLYSLRHPLEETQYVSVLNSVNSLSSAIDESIISEEIVQSNQKILSVVNQSNQGSLIFTFNSFTGQHECWKSFVLQGETRHPTPITNSAKLTDEILYEMKSKVFFQRIWSEDVHRIASGPATSLFVTHDNSGRPIVWILRENLKQLTGSSIDLKSTALSSHCEFHFNAVSAVPLYATRKPHKDILILQPDGSLVLWTGSKILTPCQLSNNFQESTQSTQNQSSKRRRSLSSDDEGSRSKAKLKEYRSLFRSPSRSSRILSLADPAYNRSNIVLSDGKIFRVYLDFIPNTYLVNSCLQALAYALPVELYNLFKSRYIRFHFGIYDNEYLNNAHSEWENFLITFLSFCQHNFSSSGPSFDEDCYDEYGGSESAWEKLLHSEFHHIESSNNQCLSKLKLEKRCRWSYLNGISKELYLISLNDPSIIAYMEPVLLAFHLIYEDAKLSTCRTADVRRIAGLLYQISCFVKWDYYSRYYILDGYTDMSLNFILGSYNSSLKLNDKSLQDSPPNIFQWIKERINTQQEGYFLTVSEIPIKFNMSIPSIFQYNPVCGMLRLITKIYNSLVDFSSEGPHAVISDIVSAGFNLDDINNLPFGVAMPIKEALRYCQHLPLNSWPIEAYKLIGREDIVGQIDIQRMTLSELSSSDSDIRASNPSIDIPTLYDSVKNSKSSDNYVNSRNELIAKLRFADTDSIEVLKSIMMNKNVPILPAKITSDMSEDIIRTEQQAALVSLSNRTFAIPFGKSLFSFGTASHILDEFIKIPELEVSAHLPPLNEAVVLDPTSLSTDFLDWPSFHEGVATGLQIPSDSPLVTSSWINQNRPENPNCRTAGFILALGLSGHLSKLQSWQLVDFFTSSHDLTTVGTTLGIAASYMGRGDAWVTRILSVHIPSLVQVDSNSINFSPLTHTASILGLGLNYMGTMQSRYADVMLNELSHPDFGFGTDVGGTHTASGSAYNEAQKNIEGHSVAAGIAFGMVMLGSGGRMGSDGISDGCTDQIYFKKLSYLIRSNRNHHNEDEMPGSNPDAAVSGAIMALSLMYLKTNNAAVASILDIPETTYMLDYIRSDLILLRTLGKSLIMWNDILPTDEWITSLLPEYIKCGYQDWIEARMNDPSLQPSDVIESLCHARYNIIAGACLSIGIKFAGTGNECAFQILLKYMDVLQREGSKPAASFGERLNKSVVRSCCDVVVTALGAVMAGTGNLELFRRLLKLYDRVSGDVSYGSHMACQIALGLLFMGGGKYTLGTSNQSIAALVTCLFPRFPTATNDNRCHLQALRHLWVLAAESRCLLTRDVDSLEPSPVPIIITLTENGKFMLGVKSRELFVRTPCLLPEFSLIESIRLNTERYWDVSIDFTVKTQILMNIQKTGNLFIKRKTGHLSYEKDPDGHLGINSRSLPSVFASTECSGFKKPVQRWKRTKSSTILQDDLLDFYVKSFSSDPRVLSFVKRYCNASNKSRPELSSPGYSDHLQSFALAVLHECLKDSKPSDLMDTYMHIYSLIENLWSEVSPHLMWNLSILTDFYQSVSQHVTMGNSNDWMNISHPLINPYFLSSVNYQIECMFRILDGRFNLDRNSNIKDDRAIPLYHIPIAPRPILPKNELSRLKSIFEEYMEDFLHHRDMYENSILHNTLSVSVLGGYVVYNHWPDKYDDVKSFLAEIQKTESDLYRMSIERVHAWQKEHQLLCDMARETGNTIVEDIISKRCEPSLYEMGLKIRFPFLSDDSARVISSIFFQDDSSS